MPKQHHYHITNTWTGNTGTGTSSYQAYERSHVVRVPLKPDLLCSSDPSFRGDPTKYNPEELLVAAISNCHMLWYLHLCAEAGIVVLDYVDKATGTMAMRANGSGHFTEVVLNPLVRLADAKMETTAMALHEKAHDFCFIANSVNFPIRCHARCVVTDK